MKSNILKEKKLKSFISTKFYY